MAYLKFAISAIPLSLLLLHSVCCNPVEQLPTATDREVQDLAKAKLASNEQNVNGPAASVHHDEDYAATGIAESKGALDEGADVEILETPNTGKDVDEPEERFRRPSLQLNTNTFTAENIEMNSAELGNSLEQTAPAPASTNESRMFTNVMVVVLVSGSVLIYVVLVIWRMRLEDRYKRQQMVVHILDEDYLEDAHNSLEAECTLNRSSQKGLSKGYTAIEQNMR